MEVKEINKSNPYCSNKNCHLPNPQILNELHREIKWKKLADAYKVSERTIRRHARLSEREKQQKEKQKGRGRKSKIKFYHLAVLYLCLLSENNNPTQPEIADYIFQKTGEKISRQTVSRLLKKNGITRKKITPQYSEQENHKGKIKEFIEATKQLPNLLSLDECSFHLNEIPRYGYSSRGFRASFKKPGKRGDNHTLILCIQNVVNKGVIHYELIEGGMKTKHFHEFLTNISLPSNKKYHLLMDNLSVHKAKQSCIDLKLTTIKELLDSKNTEPTYLPPYTPELNPTELCFNFIRQQVEKSKPRTYEELKSVIDKIIDMLNQKDMTQYFRHCWNYEKKKKVKSDLPQREISDEVARKFFNSIVEEEMSKINGQ